MAKLYPGSHVEVGGILARHYDFIMDTISLGMYAAFVEDAVKKMEIHEDHHILDLGAGTGRNALLMARYLGPGGRITAFEIGKDMIERFRENCSGIEKIELRTERIDMPFTLRQPADKAFISFVIHGLPHQSRLRTIENVRNNLKEEGTFHVLDFTEELKNKNFLIKGLFRLLECPYAWDYVNRNWKEILEKAGFKKVTENKYFNGIVSLSTYKLISTGS